MGKWQKKYKTKQKVNTYLSKHFKKMKVKFKEKPNIEEKQVNLEEATLSNTSVIRPVCVCVCGRYSQINSVQACGSQTTLLCGRECSEGEESGEWPVKGIPKVLGTFIFNPLWWFRW